MMKKLINFLFITIFIFVNSFAYAQTVQLPNIETPQGEKDVGAAISPLKADQKAPFTGVLLSPRATAIIVTELNNFDEKLRLELSKQKQEDDATCQFTTSEQKAQNDADIAIKQAQLDASLKDRKVLEEEIRNLEKSQTSKELWYALGAGSGIVVTVLTVVAISYAKK